MDPNSSAAKQMAALGRAFFNARHMSAQEAIHIILGFAMVMKSRTVIFVPTGLPAHRFRMRKSKKALELENPDSEDVFVAGLIQKYEALPRSKHPILKQVCLALFAAHYSISGAKKDADLSEDSDGESEEEDDERSKTAEQSEESAVQTLVSKLPNVIRLENNKGVATKMKRRRIVRYHRFDPLTDEDSYYYSLLLLFWPFANESTDLALQSRDPETGNARSFRTYKEFFQAKQESIRQVIEKFEMFSHIMAAAYDQLSKDRNEEINNRFAAQFDTAGAENVNERTDEGAADILDPTGAGLEGDILEGIPGSNYASELLY